MTFTEIATEVLDRAGLTSTAATTRVGREINIAYRRLTSSLGLHTSRPAVGVSANTTNGSANVTFTSMEKVERVRNENVTPATVLTEVSLDELRRETAVSSTMPRRYAIEEQTGTTVIIRLDCLANGVFALKADGIETVSTLSGSDVPNFPVSFHDILVEKVLGEELRKQEKKDDAKIAEETASRRMSELRLFLATSMSQVRRQGQLGSNYRRTIVLE